MFSLHNRIIFELISYGNLPPMKIQSSVFSSSLIAAMSSFTFGLYLTSVGLLFPVIKKSFDSLEITYKFEHYASLFATIIFLGAFFSSFFIFIFDFLSKRNLLIFNNLFYFIGASLLLKFPNVYIGLLSRFIIGLGAGISCCSVPGYIFLISNDSNRGFYMSFNSIGIVSGLVVGKVMDVFIGSENWDIALMIILFYILIHSFFLLLIKNVQHKQNTDDQGQRSILELIRSDKALKSIFLAISFHVAQHASGIDYFSCFIEDLFMNGSHAGVKSICCLSFSALVNVFSANYIDRLGRKPIILISSSIILASTAIMGMRDVMLPIALLYMFGFNVGLASIPWFISNEIFPYEFYNASQRLCVGINWLSAFILSVFLKPLHSYYGKETFYFYSFNMMCFIVLVLLLFKETKNKPVGFQ